MQDHMYHLQYYPKVFLGQQAIILQVMEHLIIAVYLGLVLVVTGAIMEVTD